MRGPGPANFKIYGKKLPSSCNYTLQQIYQKLVFG